MPKEAPRACEAEISIQSILNRDEALESTKSSKYLKELELEDKACQHPSRAHYGKTGVHGVKELLTFSEKEQIKRTSRGS